MATKSIKRPDDSNYFVDPWSETFLQGDLFRDVPFAIPAPPDAVFEGEGERRFLSGPFDAGPALLISPSCVIAAQGVGAGAGTYAHPARTVVPIRTVEDLIAGGALGDNLGHLRADRLRSYLYLPPAEPLDGAESAALLYMPITVHHDVIAGSRSAQLTGAAFWHLRAKLAAYTAGYLIHPEAFGEVPDPQERSS